MKKKIQDKFIIIIITINKVKFSSKLFAITAKTVAIKNAKQKIQIQIQIYTYIKIK